MMAPTVSEFRSAATLVGEIPANRDVILSPRFRSAAAIAGWDEEALLAASLVVEDTPIRLSKRSKSPSDSATNSRRKRRKRRESLRITPLNLVLEEVEFSKNAGPNSDPKKSEAKEAEEKKSAACAPCFDRLREELSCAICLEICFEPSTTPCGHSFCKKCLKSATTRCGRRCPKCRDPITNARSCAVNTVLWNTIQLLFPDEIAKRRSSSSPVSSAKKTTHPFSSSSNSNNARLRRFLRRSEVGEVSSDRMQSEDAALAQRLQREETTVSLSSSSNSNNARLRRFLRRSEIGEASRERMQSEDAALALRLQREEMMAEFRANRHPVERINAVSLARANLRAMASRAVQIRSRRRQC